MLKKYSNEYINYVIDRNKKLEKEKEELQNIAQCNEFDCHYLEEENKRLNILVKNLTSLNKTKDTRIIEQEQEIIQLNFYKVEFDKYFNICKDQLNVIVDLQEENEGLKSELVLEYLKNIKDKAKI